MADEPKANLFVGDAQAILTALAFYLALFQPVGHGGALALGALYLVIHGALRRLATIDPQFRSRFFQGQAKWVSWTFMVSGAVLLFLSLVLWQLNQLEIRAVRVPIHQDHPNYLLSFASTSASGTAQNRPENQYQTRAEFKHAQSESLLYAVAAGLTATSIPQITRKRGDTEEQVPARTRNYVVRSVELEKRYMPFKLRVNVRSPHSCIAAQGLLLEKDPVTGTFTKLSALPTARSTDGKSISINVLRPLPESQIGLVVRIARLHTELDPSTKMDELFTRTSFFIE